MKKLLLAIAVLSASLTASAQAMNQRFNSVNQTSRKADVASLRTSLPIQQRKATLRHTAAVRNAAGVSNSSLAGEYIVTLLSDFGNAYNTCSNVTVTPLGSDSIILSGVNYYGDIHAKVNSDNTIEIPSQVVYNSRSYGKESIAKYSLDNDYNVNVLRTEKITGTIDTEDNSIWIEDDSWGLFIDSGEYADEYFDLWAETAFQKPNGTFTYSNPNINAGKDTTINVAIAEYGDTLVSVSNFANIGDVGFYVEMNLAKDSSVTVPVQYVYAGTEEEGNYFLAGVSGSSLIQETGVGTENTITLDPFTLYSDSSYWFNMFTTNIIKLNDGIKFTYPSDNTAGIRSLTGSRMPLRTEYYTISGARCTEPRKGLNIEVVRFDDGTTATRKIITK